MLNGYSAQLAKRKAPLAAEKTEASKGALIPRATVIVTANSRSKTLLKKAVVRVCHPSTSRTPILRIQFRCCRAHPTLTRSHRLVLIGRVLSRSGKGQHSGEHNSHGWYVDPVSDIGSPHSRFKIALCFDRLNREVISLDVAPVCVRPIVEP
jgi:hypothetical protein